METKAVSGIMLALLFMCMLTLAYNIQLVEAESTAIISVYPSTSIALVGETFTVNVTVTDVSNLFAWQFMIRFDPNVLHVENVTEGPFLASTGEETDFLPPIMDNTEGYIISGCIFLPPFPEYGVTGSGVLATITFLAKAEGATSLGFEDETYTYLREVRWTDYQAIPPVGYKLPIACILVDAYIYARVLYPEYTVLNATCHALLVNYGNLLDDFNSLSVSYNDLLDSYDNLVTYFNSLNSTHQDLLDIYTQLQSDFSDLESKHDTLTGDLGTTRNLSYIFVITTIVFIATTVYLAIAKSKVKTESRNT